MSVDRPSPEWFSLLSVKGVSLVLVTKVALYSRFKAISKALETCLCAILLNEHAKFDSSMMTVIYAFRLSCLFVMIGVLVFACFAGELTLCHCHMI